MTTRCAPPARTAAATKLRGPDLDDAATGTARARGGAAVGARRAVHALAWQLRKLLVSHRGGTAASAACAATAPRRPATAVRCCWARRSHVRAVPAV
eukprot:353932-Chlamydomonas_euryale.AAC.1